MCQVQTIRAIPLSPFQSKSSSRRRKWPRDSISRGRFFSWRSSPRDRLTKRRKRDCSQSIRSSIYICIQLIFAFSVAWKQALRRKCRATTVKKIPNLSIKLSAKVDRGVHSLKALLHCEMFRATCLAMFWRHCAGTSYTKHFSVAYPCKSPCRK